MTMTRRNFIKTSAIAGGILAGPSAAHKGININTRTAGSKGLKLSFRPYELHARHQFTISGFSRNVQTSILTEISYDGVTGYGEAPLPPYMEGQTPATASAFMKKVDLGQFRDPLELDDILTYLEGVDAGHTGAKAGIDIALHDLAGKLIGRPLYQIWGYTRSKTPDTTMTIGIDSEDVVRKKTEEAAPFNLIKVKLGMDEATDKMLIETVRSVTDKPITIDANQGWRDKHYALDMIHWLKERGVILIEQPLPKDVWDDMAWLTEKSPLPTIADESCQRLTDVPRLRGVFSGINIKLLKCTGLREANRMISMAEAFGMKLMIGCTMETSCGISAAAQLTPKMDYADLDGNFLISNDCFSGVKIVNGKITLNDRPGIGAEPIRS
ncbi:MAG TPA: dipeptide epimerase [Planctomycetota bacterium]|nr:dipeptide epimerase [Planctomycetota bacterium]OQC19313.1 MAG: L-Ala-D/L-Glu epimerase [Planctomycetes bacterium ADurb.Bin069]HOT83876.1 dipeptide epimerase [Candidatus Defluviicoccus seviourii]NMD35126.1 dipeptide epimerase [Planctomycetota bacterium]HNS00427.1 dipeptide epimerase [Planctomycetota bacterium]